MQVPTCGTPWVTNMLGPREWFFGWIFCDAVLLCKGRRVSFSFDWDLFPHQSYHDRRKRNDLAKKSWSLMRKHWWLFAWRLQFTYLASWPHGTYLDTKCSAFFQPQTLACLRQDEWMASLFYGFEVSVRNPSSPADLWSNTSQVRWCGEIPVKTNKFILYSLKIDGWRMNFPFKMVPFSGDMLISGGGKFLGTS